MINITKEIELISIEIKDKKGQKVRIVNVYMHPKENKEAIEILDKNLGSYKKILCGDFNAHHPYWSRGKKNKIGRMFEEITLENALKQMDRLVLQM